MTKLKAFSYETSHNHFISNSVLNLPLNVMSKISKWIYYETYFLTQLHLKFLEKIDFVMKFSTKRNVIRNVIWNFAQILIVWFHIDILCQVKVGNFIWMSLQIHCSIHIDVFFISFQSISFIWFEIVQSISFIWFEIVPVSPHNWFMDALNSQVAIFAHSNSFSSTLTLYSTCCEI